MYRIENQICKLINQRITLSLKNESSRGVFLSFDDGPSPETTLKTLQLLEKYDAKATFFPIGKNIEEYPEILQTIKEKGHSVHHHSWSHDRKQLKSVLSLKEELLKSSEYINSNVFRPPYGRVTYRQYTWLKKNGYKIVLWNVNPADYSKRAVDTKKFNQLIKKIVPGDIILLHNNPKFFDKSYAMAQQILSELSSNKFLFEKIK